MIAPLVHLLCALTCWTCAVLLLRGFLAHRNRLLLWSGAAFCIFGISNVLLFVDLTLVPTIDLSYVRNGVTLLGVMVLVWGLVWETSA
jgi:hypothetical protein